MTRLNSLPPTQDTRVAAAAGAARRAWTTPNSTRRGSVAELVQIQKTSGTSDCSGQRRKGTGSHC